MKASQYTYSKPTVLYNLNRIMQNKRSMLTRHIFPAVLVVLCMTAVVVPANAQETDEDAYSEIYELILDEQWAEASEAIEDFIETEEFNRSPWSDDVRYWQCFANEKRGGDYLKEAYDCYSGFPKMFSRSAWVDDTKSGMIRVAQILAKDGNPEYAVAVESMQKSDDEEVALSALYALQNIGDEKALRTIMGLYERSESERLRGKIVYILGNFDSPEVVTMLADIATSDAPTRIRKNAVNALGNRDEQEARDILKKVVTSNGDVDVQKAALYSLGNSETADILAFLREVALTSEKEELGKAATYAIGNTDSRSAIEALQAILRNGRHTDVRKAALHSLGNIDDATSKAILLEIAMNDVNRELQKAAVYSISNQDDSFDELTAIFKSASAEEVRRASLYALGNLDDPKVSPFLLDIVLNEEDIGLAKNAVYALSNHDDGEEFIVTILEESNRVEVKKAALYQLSDNLAALMNVLKNESSAELRKTAVYAMGNSDEDEIVPFLLDVAKNDSDLSVRKAAISALGNIGSDEAQAALIQILEQN